MAAAVLLSLPARKQEQALVFFYKKEGPGIWVSHKQEETEISYLSQKRKKKNWSVGYCGNQKEQDFLSFIDKKGYYL